MYYNKRETCVCGIDIVVNKNPFGFVVSMDIHRETQKHRDLMELKTQDHESWKLALEGENQECKMFLWYFRI